MTVTGGLAQYRELFIFALTTNENLANAPASIPVSVLIAQSNVVFEAGYYCANPEEEVFIGVGYVSNSTIKITTEGLGSGQTVYVYGIK